MLHTILPCTTKYPSSINVQIQFRKKYWHSISIKMLFSLSILEKDKISMKISEQEFSRCVSRIVWNKDCFCCSVRCTWNSPCVTLRSEAYAMYSLIVCKLWHQKQGQNDSSFATCAPSQPCPDTLRCNTSFMWSLICVLTTTCTEQLC